MKKICVIDSGYHSENEYIKKELIERAITVRQSGDNIFSVTEGAEDNIGHGTAILSILQNDSEDRFIIIKIFEQKLECDEQLLLYTLQYIYHFIECDIINLSLGITSCTLKSKLYDICRKLKERNTIITAAFDNSGMVSYPAAFSCVIGVDNDPICRSRNEMVCIENSMVNVFAFGRTQRIPWLVPKYIFMSGSSLSCAYVTRYLASLSVDTMEEAMLQIHRKANYIEKKDNCIYENTQADFIGSIQKAIIFPYNKEMHSIVKFYSLLQFELCNVFDIVKSGNVGRKVKTFDGVKEYIVQDWSKIDWEGDFDTIILGHLEEYNMVTNENWAKKMLSLGQKYNKRIYCFDDASALTEISDTIQISWPSKLFVSHKFGKLYEIRCPVLGIFGTGSKQGKYTLQLILRKMFMERGYKIGQIGSEPSALLFGMDDVFHFGYNKHFNLDGKIFIEAINDSLNQIQEKGVDIILAGCQSGTIPYDLTNIQYATCQQIDFLTGLNPDKVILCVNIFDELEYISRTIRAIEAVASCDVVAIVLYPMTFAGEYAMSGTPSRKAEDHEIALKLNEIMCHCRKPCFELGINMDELFEVVVDHFT